MVAGWILHSTDGHCYQDTNVVNEKSTHISHTYWSNLWCGAYNSYPSLYLMTASMTFFIFLVRDRGLGESFSAGGRPRFFAFFPSSSFSLTRLLEQGVAGPPSWSLSLLRFLDVFLWRTSSSMSSRLPSSMAYRQKQSNAFHEAN